MQGVRLVSEDASAASTRHPGRVLLYALMGIALIAVAAFLFVKPKNMTPKKRRA
jgi:hypothetical protein